MGEGKETKLVKGLEQVSILSIQYHERWVAESTWDDTEASRGSSTNPEKVKVRVVGREQTTKLGLVITLALQELRLQLSH
jgi:hypothetical protein